MKNALKSLILVFMTVTTVWAQQTMTINKQGYYPEGIAYYKAKKLFLMGSMTQGEIGAIDKNGNFQTYLSDPAIISPVGIKVDQEKEWLYISNSDIGVSRKTVKAKQAKTAQLLVFDLKSKKRIALYDFTKLSNDGLFFANDLTFDHEGNIYLTNSFGPSIWKVDTQGNISLFAQHTLFEVEANHFGLNGIVYHPDGYLLVAHYAKGALYKVPVANPKAVETVQLTFTAMGADGLEFIDNESIVMICNNSDNIKLNATYTLQSANGWKSARVKKVNPLADAFPTTSTRQGNKLFVLYGYLDRMLTGTKPAQSTFEIVEVDY